MWFKGSEIYGEDYTVNEDGYILAFTYIFGPRETYSEQLSYGESFKQNFNLNVNSTKSSVFESDVDENSVKEIMAKDTVVLSGTYADDTTFNFTIPVIK